MRVEARAANSNDAWLQVAVQAGETRRAQLAACRSTGFTDTTRLSKISVTAQQLVGGVTAEKRIVSILSCPDAAQSIADCSVNPQTYLDAANKDNLLISDCDAHVLNVSKWAFRLVGGPDNTTGKLELLPEPHGLWGPVCDNSKLFAASATLRAAACMTLGFNYTEALQRKTVRSPGEFILPPASQCTGATQHAFRMFRLLTPAPARALLPFCRTASCGRTCKRIIQRATTKRLFSVILAY